MLPSLLVAQFSVQSKLSFDFGKDAAIDSVDNVVVFQKIDSTARLQYIHTDSAIFEWHYHTPISDSLILSSVTNDTITILDSLVQGAYELRIDTSLSLFYSVVDFYEYQPVLDSVWFNDQGDSCNTIALFATVKRDSIGVYDKRNDSTHLLQVPTTLYQWKDTVIPSADRVDAPYEDIAYECTPYSDDFFPDNGLTVSYTSPDTLSTELYTAIAVTLGVIDPSIPEDAPDYKSNVIESSTEDKGSAPLSVTYTVDPKGADEFKSWWIWPSKDDQPNSPTYRYQNQITHTFRTYEESGYSVKVAVGNDFCVDTAITTVDVYESALQVPNILILGFNTLEGGKFKVAYTSIDPSTFKAAVYDRWGRLMYKWEDPNGGWDGRSPLGGAYVAPGPYYYIIRAEGTDGRKYEKKGALNVIREKGIR